MSIRDWWGAFLDSPLRAETVIVAAIAVAMALRTALHRTHLGRRLDAGLTLLVIGLLAFALAFAATAEGVMAVVPYARAVGVTALAIAAVRVVMVLLVDVYLRERQQARVSAIVRDSAGLVAYFIIILLVLRATLDINLASLIATSAVLTAIIGLALQDVLGSIISGLVLEAEEPFQCADWVRVGTFEGQVVETGWRTTQIRTRDNELVVLPNTYVAREPLVNYVRPDPRHRDKIRFEAAYEAPPNAVKDAVLGVLRGESAVLREPAPDVHTARFNASGIEYEARYWLTDFARMPDLRDRIMTNIWYAFRRHGIRIPFPATDLFLHHQAPLPALEAGDVADGLRRIPLLEPLTPEELALLAGHVRRRVYARGEKIVREGEPGDSIYLIEHGDVRVVIGTTGGNGHLLNRMAAGEYFGEMSLLTGEARSATVIAESDVSVLEVGRPAFEQILVANPALLEPISQIAAHRQEAQRETRRAQVVIPPFAQDAAAQRLRQRIRAFFGL